MARSGFLVMVMASVCLAATPAGAFVFVPANPVEGNGGPILSPYPAVGEGNYFLNEWEQSFPDGGMAMPDEGFYVRRPSEAFVSIRSVPPPVATPEPATAMLFGLGLTGTVIVARKLLR